MTKKKANPTVIGAFVVGAVLLGVAAIVYFGGGEYFGTKGRYVAYFEGSMKGLSIGSPVTYHGTRIGAVSNIVVRYDSKDGSVRVPVYFEIEQDRIHAVRERRDPYAAARSLIGEGLRAQLVMQSLVTGQIAVELAFHPKDPVVLVGAEPKFFEFPTIPSTFEKLNKALEDFDLQAVLNNISTAVDGISELANSSKLREAIASVDTTVKDFGKLARDIDAKVDPIVTTFDDTATSARQALDQARESIASVEGKLNPALEDAQKLIQDLDGTEHPAIESFVRTSETAQAALEQARIALTLAGRDYGQDSELYRSVVRALDELASTAKSIRMLAEFLEQNPEALLQGKHPQGSK